MSTNTRRQESSRYKINKYKNKLFTNKFYLSSSLFLQLLSVEARAEIVGPTVKYLTPGSTLKLVCRVVQSTENPAFIFWYHNNRMINYDGDRGINVSAEAGKLKL